MSRIFRAILIILAFVIQTSNCSLPVFSQSRVTEIAKSSPAISSIYESSKTEDKQSALPVFYPAVLSPNLPLSIMAPVPVPVTKAPVSPTPIKPAALSVSQMRGEVHFKHLEGPSLDPARALYIETGNGVSFCEFKMANCTGRTWSNSQAAVFPESGVIYLKKGAVILQVKRESGAHYTIMAGELSCRVEGTTIRVQKDEHSCNFQVLDSTPITVYNRRTGEITRASTITIPNR